MPITLDHRRNLRALQLLLRHSVWLGPSFVLCGGSLWGQPKITLDQVLRIASAGEQQPVKESLEGTQRISATRLRKERRLRPTKVGRSQASQKEAFDRVAVGFGKSEAMTIKASQPERVGQAKAPTLSTRFPKKDAYSPQAVSRRAIGSGTAAQVSTPGFGKNEALVISIANAGTSPTARTKTTVLRAKSSTVTRTDKVTSKSPTDSSGLKRGSALSQFLNQKAVAPTAASTASPIVVPQDSSLLAAARIPHASVALWDTETSRAGTSTSVLTLHKKVQPDGESKVEVVRPVGKVVVTTKKAGLEKKPTSEEEKTATQRSLQGPALALEGESNPASTAEFNAQAVTIAVENTVPAALATIPSVASPDKKSATDVEKEAQATSQEKVAEEESAIPPTKGPDGEGETEKAVYSTKAYEQLPATVIASEASPKLTFSGDLCSFIGGVNQEDAREDKDGSPHFAFGWADLSMEISGEATENLQYKYFADIQIVPNDLCMTDNYFELSSPFATIQFGNLKGVESALIEDATSLDGGTGGVDGSVWDLFNRSAGLPNFVHLAGFTKRATKLTLYSPRLYGFKVGLSYTPNPGHSGWDGPDSNDYANSNSNDDDVFHNADMKKRNNVAYGINYENSLNDLTISAALVCATEKTTMNIDLNALAQAEDPSDPTKSIYQESREIALKKDTAIQGSASLKYKNIQIAGGFIDNGELNLPKTQHDADRLAKYGLHLGHAGKGWNAGIKVSYGCLDMSLTHHEMSRRVTNFNDTHGSVNTFAVDCQVVSGVTLFTEINRVSTSTDKDVAALYDNEKPTKNQGTTIFVGTKVSF